MTTIAATADGAVAGAECDGVLRFAGIPYAAPPSGRLRFTLPQPPAPWTGVRPALGFGPPSLQVESPLQDRLGGPSRPGSEDCLSLTVYTPAADGRTRPVVVWIHGGGFVSGTSGSPVWNGARLARRGDLVVVAVNYRLGALGFLALGEVDPALVSSGLNGILDQQAALRWVQQNIAAFGGDPDNVTLWGASAGAMSVAALLAMPTTRGLVRRAVLQSGAGQGTVDPAEGARRARRFCALAGARSVDDLRALPASRLLQLQAELPGALGEHGPPTWARGFQPVVDGHALPDHPAEVAERGELPPIEVLIGTTEEEWRLFSWMETGPDTDAELAARFGAALPDPAGAIALYRRRLGADAGSRRIYEAMMTDLRFRVPMARLAGACAAAGNPTWVYRFAYRTPVADGLLGACHALDVPFVFDNRDGPVERFVGPASPDALADAMQQSWIAFARHGDPNHDGIPAWAPQDDTRRPVIRFDACTTMTEDPEGDELAAWAQPPT